jgi:hypothetical protein
MDAAVGQRGRQPLQTSESDVIATTQLPERQLSGDKGAIASGRQGSCRGVTPGHLHVLLSVDSFTRVFDFFSIIQGPHGDKDPI